MEYRSIGKTDMEQAVELAQYCFHESPAFTEWYFQRRADKWIGAYRNRMLCGMAAIIDCEIGIGGEELPAALLSYLAVRPELRGQGLGAEIVRNVLKNMKKRGAVLSSLYPFDFGYYRKLGWETCTEVLKIRVALSELPHFAERISVEMLEDDSLVDAMTEVYSRYMARYSGFSVRDSQAFLRRLEMHQQDDGYAILLREDSVPVGLMLYHFEGKIISCDEVCMLTAESRKAVVNFLSGHASSYAEAAIALPPDDPLRRMLGDGRDIATLEPFAMYRILDVEKAFSGRKCGSGAVLLRVEDPLVPENTGTFSFRNINGRIDCRRVEEEPEMAVSIQDMAKWLLGRGYELGEDGCDPEVSARMCALLPERKTFLYEMY